MCQFFEWAIASMEDFWNHTLLYHQSHHIVCFNLYRFWRRHDKTLIIFASNCSETMFSIVVRIVFHWCPFVSILFSMGSHIVFHWFPLCSILRTFAVSSSRSQLWSRDSGESRQGLRRISQLGSTDGLFQIPIMEYLDNFGYILYIYLY